MFSTVLKVVHLNLLFISFKKWKDSCPHHVNWGGVGVLMLIHYKENPG